jgi:hypothetical protein
MSLERAIEEIIQAAMARGEFDNLPGKGKPLNLDDYFSLPEHERMALTMLRNAGYLPEEVQLLKDANELKKKLALTTNPEEKAKLKQALDDKVLAYHVAMERRARRRNKK